MILQYTGLGGGLESWIVNLQRDGILFDPHHRSSVRKWKVLIGRENQVFCMDVNGESVLIASRSVNLVVNAVALEQWLVQNDVIPPCRDILKEDAVMRHGIVSIPIDTSQVSEDSGEVVANQLRLT